MTLRAGAGLGTYEILAPTGAGGRGEVYRAHDTRLGRDAALKLLPDAFSQDPERLARFEREAQLLTALNQANIAAIYGPEEAEGPRFLVLSTCRARLSKGPCPSKTLWDVAPDARRFLMFRGGSEEETAAAPPQLHVVLEWFAEIRRRVRSGG